MADEYPVLQELETKLKLQWVDTDDVMATQRAIIEVTPEHAYMELPRGPQGPQGPKGDKGEQWTKRDLTTGEDLNTVIEPGLYTIPSYTLAMSLANRPPNEAMQSATLRVTESGGGAIKQRWERLGLASHRLVTMERSRDSTNTWSAWELVPDTESVKAADWFKGVIPDGANLDTYQTPGEYEIPSYNVARSLSGRPDGLIQRAMLKVRVAGGTAMHELTEWTAAGVRVWKRETAGGTWRPWREGEESDLPNTPLQPVYMWGDSAVAGGDTNGGWAAGENLPGRIGALLDTPVESRGVSGHTANTTLIRAGVFEIWATGTIPADTSEASISVAGLDIDLRVRRTFAASWDGIAGTLAIDGDDFTFKRTSAGTAQTISTPTRVILNTAVPLGEGAHIFLMGGNDWLSDAGTAPEANKELHLVESYRRVVEAVPGDPLKKVLIGGLKTRRSTTAGDENDRLVRAVNQRLRTLYPGIFVDRQAWLVSRGLAAAGITPTPADTAAMAAGLVPPSAFATGDDTHIRKEVVQAEAAELWANALVRKGWARLKSGTTLPAQVDTYQLGASITDRTGVGFPGGKVAAPVGSTYTDTVATNGAIRWVKASGTGNTGWRVEYGDTGWRNLSSFLPATWSGEMAVTRTENRVTIIGSNIRPGETGNTHILELPAGFRPARTATGVGDESGAYRPVYAFNYSPYNLQIRYIAAVNSWVNFSITYVTQDAWPTTLPGTPA